MEILLLLGGAALLLLATQKKGATGDPPSGNDPLPLPRPSGGDRPTLDDLPEPGGKDSAGIEQFRQNLEQAILSRTGQAVKLTSTTKAELRQEYLMVLAKLGKPVGTAPYPSTGNETPLTDPKFVIGQIVKTTTMPRTEDRIRQRRWNPIPNDWEYLLSSPGTWFPESLLEGESLIPPVKPEPKGTNKFSIGDQVRVPGSSQPSQIRTIDQIRWTGFSWNYHFAGMLNFTGENALVLVTRAPPPVTPKFSTGDRVTTKDGPGTVGGSNWIVWNPTTNQWDYYLVELMFWYQESALVGATPEPEPFATPTDSGLPFFRIGDRVITKTGKTGIISNWKWTSPQEVWFYLLEDNSFTWWQESLLRAA